MTRTGQPVQITDNGQPLWVLRSAIPGTDNPERAHAIDELLDEVLRDARVSLSLSKIVKDARR